MYRWFCIYYYWKTGNSHLNTIKDNLVKMYNKELKPDGKECVDKDGSVFDSTEKHGGEPLEFVVGIGCKPSVFLGSCCACSERKQSVAEASASVLPLCLRGQAPARKVFRKRAVADAG